MASSELSALTSELESLHQLHADSHEQLSTAWRNSNVLLQRLRSLTSTWKVPTSTPELLQIEESPKARPRRNSLSVPRPNAKLGLRVPSVDQLESALMRWERAPSLRKKASSIVSHVSLGSGSSLSHVDNPTTRSKSKGSFRPGNATSSVSQAFEGIMAPGLPAAVVPEESPGELKDPNGAVEGMTTEQQRHGTISLANLNKGAHKEILESWGAQDEQGEEPDDLGSHILLKMPKLLYALIPLQAMISVSFLLASNSMRELQVNHFSSIVSRFLYIAASAVCPFLLFRSLSSRDLKLAVGRLNEFLADFTLEWRTVAGRHWFKHALAWSLMVLLEFLTQGLFIWDSLGEDANGIQTHHIIDVLSVVSFAVCSAWLYVVAYTQSHLLAALDVCLDCWCYDLVGDTDFPSGVITWNRLQALLKSVGRSLASSFIAMQALGAIGLVYSLASGIMVCFQSDFSPERILREALSSLPVIFLFTLNMTVCAKGAALTEKCRNIPALVNQLPSAECIDMERQYLVNFLKDSAAGFCVKDVRLTSEMLAKLFIIVGGIISGLFAAASRAI